MADTSELHDALLDRLNPFHQQQLLRFWSELNSAQQDDLQHQIESVDLERIHSLVSASSVETNVQSIAEAAVPPPAVTADGGGIPWTLADAVQRGEEALASGHVAAVIVAGGQGTRLGFDHPKGMFPIGPVSNRSLFQFFADRLIATRRRYGKRIPLYLMTSEATDKETRDYFERNDHLGLDAEDIIIFKQGTMPAVDANSGQLLMASKHSLALSPDGHGGTVSALERSGCLADARQRGVQHLAYIQVDNPLAALCDPSLIGHHLMARSEMTTQVVRKREPLERVGNVVEADGKIQIIEYSDLPDHLAQATTETGELKLWAGNIAVHVIDREFLERSVGSADSLPFHLARKKVACLSDSGELIEPDQPNAIKFEKFIFDLLPEARNAFVVEARSGEAFAPVKNAAGAATDTADLARQAIGALHCDWVERAGGSVDQGIQVEINPRFALDMGELKEKLPANLRIESDRYFDT